MKAKVFFLVFVMLLVGSLSSLSQAQVATTITPTAGAGNLGTTVTPAGNVYNITNGTRMGSNLFHSFGLFSVGTGDTANFINNLGLPTSNSNIFSRVTGGNPSNIFGTIQTTGFGSASLYLINPAGVIFGSTASLNVGGSFHASTADYLKMSDGNLFVASPAYENAVTSNGPISTVLSSASPAAFGFLNPNPAAIVVQGSNLQVPQGQSMSFVGGDITVTGGTLSAPSGQINLVSVASAGEVLLPSMQYGPNVNGDVFTSMGTINLSQGATLDASGDAAGTVLIRGGQLVMADATISADTVNTNGASIAVDINVTGDVAISNNLGNPAITARSSGDGDAGVVRIVSGTLEVTSNTLAPSIDTHTTGMGKAGNVSITTTGSLEVAGDPSGDTFFIDSGPRAGGAGRGGDVEITAGSAQFQDVTITTGDMPTSDGTGPSGNVTITAGTLKLTHSNIFTDTFSARAGDITITAGDIQTTFSIISAIGLDGGGAITVTAGRLVTDFTSFDTETALSAGGNITVNANVVELTNGSTLSSVTFGDAPAGSIHVTATDHVSLLGNFGGERPSGIFSNSFGGLGSAGDSGAITITTPSLQMTGGARINSATQTAGRGGDVTINVTGSISISGELPTGDPEPLFGLGSIHPSGIFTQTVGSDFCTATCGDAGRVSISTGSLTMGAGARIDSGTSNTGRGGDVTVNAGAISISGLLSDGTPSGIFSRTVGNMPGAGVGGNIVLGAGQVRLNSGATISAQSTGTGNAGNITILASDSFVSRNSTVTTGTVSSDGGNITLQVGRLVQLVDSQITTSVQGGTGNGGNITIDPTFVILQRSQIIANAFGGNGGNILIVADMFFTDPFSVISASSTLGINGTVNIQAPITNLSGTLAPLSEEFLQAAGLLRASCAARFQGGNVSSFVVAGRDGMPLEPGGLLPSPLFIENSGSSRLARSLNVPDLRVGRSFGDQDLTLAALSAGCAS